MHSAPPPRRTLLLALGALGVVYGDIGTSPLYAFRECVHGVAPEFLASQALGAASLVVWSLTLLVTIKYLVLVLRADNHGEGGILALMSLATRGDLPRRGVLVALGVFGAALLYGDGILTPAVTVLGAMEGLKEAWPMAEPAVVPGTVLILVGLFVIQRHGTNRVGVIFGPVMVCWFLVLAALGLASVIRTPAVVTALNPLVAVNYVAHSGWHSFAILGSVFLAVTGAEALYADLGHFGSRPIRLAWSTLAFPALALNYLGQAALVIRDPSSVVNPFYRLAPGALQAPLVALAALAGIVASQALITGAFSLTMQALQLGFLPRIAIQHTSAAQRGQIFITVVNLALAVGCILLVLVFRSSNALAAAYGIAVSLTMVITTILLGEVARHLWKWSALRTLLVIGTFLVIDLGFLGANLLKILDGGWIPLLLGGILFTVMTTWHRGREIMARRINQKSVSLVDFIARLQNDPSIRRVPGTAVFLSGSPDAAPVPLLQNLKHNQVVHERIFILRFAVENLPHVGHESRIAIEAFPAGFHRITARFGFMEEPSLTEVRELCAAANLTWEDLRTTYFLGHESIIPARHPALPRWRAALFRLLSRNAQQPAAFFRIPPNRVVEFGVQMEL